MMLVMQIGGYGFIGLLVSHDDILYRSTQFRHLRASNKTDW